MLDIPTSWNTWQAKVPLPKLPSVELSPWRQSLCNRVSTSLRAWPKSNYPALIKRLYPAASKPPSWSLPWPTREKSLGRHHNWKIYGNTFEYTMHRPARLDGQKSNLPPLHRSCPHFTCSQLLKFENSEGVTQPRWSGFFKKRSGVNCFWLGTLIGAFTRGISFLWGTRRHKVGVQTSWLLPQLDCSLTHSEFT